MTESRVRVEDTHLLFIEGIFTSFDSGTEIQKHACAHALHELTPRLDGVEADAGDLAKDEATENDHSFLINLYHRWESRGDLALV